MAKEFGHGLEPAPAVEIVGVDDRERLQDLGRGRQDRMGRAPGFSAFWGALESGRQVGQLLKNVIDGDLSQQPAEEDVPKIGLNFPADDEDDLAETGPQGIIDGIIDDGLPAGADAVHLFKAAVSTSNPGGQNDEGGFHVISPQPNGDEKRIINREDLPTV